MDDLLGNGLIMALDRDAAKGTFAARDNQSLRTAILDAHALAGADLWADCQRLWEPMHQTLLRLAQGNDNELRPLDACILGGRQLQREPGMIVAAKRPDMVPVIANALEAIDLTEFWHQGHESLGDGTEALLALLKQIIRVYRRSTEERCAVVFATATGAETG